MAAACNLQQKQQGATLIVALVFLLVLTVAGITAVRFATFEERMASNAQFRNQNFQQTQSEVRAQVLYFITPIGRTMLVKTRNAALNEHKANGVPPSWSSSILLADPTLRSLPTTAGPRLQITPILSNMQNQSSKSYIRYGYEHPCEDGSNVEKFTCISFELSAQAGADDQAYSRQLQGLTFQNIK